MKTVAPSDVRCLMIAATLVATACGDDTTPVDDAGYGTDTSSSSTTNGGVTITTVTPTTADDTTGDDTDDGTTTGPDETTTGPGDTTTGDTGQESTEGTTGDTGQESTEGTTGDTGEESTETTTTGDEPCTDPEDCPDPGNECLARTCENDVCGTMPVADGEPTATQTIGDCRLSQCDGAGNAVDVVDDADLPDDDNDCTENLCNDGDPEHPPLGEGEVCSSMDGQVCDGLGLCVECVTDAECGGGTCTDNACAPNVIATVPDEGTVDVPVASPVTVTFSHAMDPSTLGAQTDVGPCTGSIQVSHDGFDTCIGFTAAAPAMSNGDTVATLTPAPALAHGVAYDLRVTTDAESATGLALGAEHLSSFSTVAPSVCEGTVVISQVYGAGGNSGALLTNDFVELHNTGSTPVTLEGWSVQYASTSGSTWGGNQLTPLHGTIAPGGYYLVQLAGGANGSPMPDADAFGTTNMAASNGKVALVSDTEALSGSCPLGPSVVDFVGYGTANCSEGLGATPAISTTTAAHRDVAGCFDGNDNASDFALGVPTPRNSATTPAFCSCSLDIVLNETDDPDEADFCNLQHPPSFSVDELQTTEVLYGRLFEAGLTEADGEPAGVVAQVGYGRPAADIADLDVGWAWFSATYNAQIGNDDEYMASFPAPAVDASTGYDYTYRFSVDDGLSWTYCDVDGAGSDPGLDFDPAALGIMTVDP